MRLLRLDQLIDVRRLVKVWNRAFAKAPQRRGLTVTLQ
jgi:hypothetical protein